MNSRSPLLLMALGGLLLATDVRSRAAAPTEPTQRPGTQRTGTQRTGTQRPNVVYIMSDELAYYELGHMGNSRLHTPRIDALATEGVRFTRAYAGAPVCAPLRCNLMTGKHAGHASVRANDGGTPLREGEVTIASLLHDVGYATGGFGKWGCGGRDSTGVPEEHGFDEFFGYYDQVHAHTFYPPYLIHNSEEVPLAGNDGGRAGATYSHYEIIGRALGFIRANQHEPFFCYLPITPPHGMYDIPESDPAWQLYEDDEWMRDAAVPQDAKNYAAMVSMIDRNVGQVLDLLEELGLSDNTIVFFTGDNGGQDRFRSDAHPRGFFGPNVDPRSGRAFRGSKGNLFEGGLRIPWLVRWPGRIEPGRVSDHLLYQPDVLPSLATLCGAATPADTDGLSFLPELLGTGTQPQHPWLYWEFGNQLAVRIGDMKGILQRPKRRQRGGGGDWDLVLESAGADSWQLYDLESDPGETENIAAAHPDLLARMREIATEQHEPVRAGTYRDPARTRHQRDRKARNGLGEKDARARRTASATDLAALGFFGEDLLFGERLQLVAASSENTAGQKLARHVVDGDPRTHWHSSYAGEVETHPHVLTLDLGGLHEVRGFRYLARQDRGWNGAFARTSFHVAADRDALDSSPAVATVNFEQKKTAQAADLEEPVRGRFVRIIVHSELNGRPWASAAELGVLATAVDK